MKTQIKKISPKIAQGFLDANTDNRKVSHLHVSQLAAEMTKGRWIENGVSIIFDETQQRLIDGQHRLYAIIKCKSNQKELNVYPSTCSHRVQLA